jgi:hypothetical protein
MKFETQAQIYRALLEGKKLTCNDADFGIRYLFLNNGVLVDDKYKTRVESFHVPEVWDEYVDIHQNLEDSAQFADELADTLRELVELSMNEDSNVLNCGMHMMSVYEKLMLSLESNLDPAYRKNIKEFRQTKLGEV